MPKYIGLFEGDARKAIALAAKHPEIDIVAVDAKKIDPKKTLASMGIAMPPNLVIRGETDAVNYVKSLSPGSVDHFWAHFPDIATGPEEELNKAIMRALKPGAKYTVFASAFNRTVVPSALRRHGFKVTVKDVTADEALKLGTKTASRQASDLLYSDRWLSTVPLARAKELADVATARNRKALKDDWLEKEGAKPSKQAKAQLRHMLDDMPRMFGKTPFFVAHAKKPIAPS